MLPSLKGTPSVHGVRQDAPAAVLASAPGGSDSMRTLSTAGVGLNVGNAGISIVGIHDAEHPDTKTPHTAKAMTRLMVAFVPVRCSKPKGTSNIREEMAWAQPPQA